MTKTTNTANPVSPSSKAWSRSKNVLACTRTDSPTHICQEVIDNAADEALGGFATEIDVRIHDDGSLSVCDNGRGIPVGLHPVEGVPVVELVFTRLHAGGKFNKKTAAARMPFQAACTAGVSVTNALHPP